MFSFKKAQAATATGYLDKANNKMIAGWARDDDYDGPISVHIYVDRKAVKAIMADDYRSDVGNHAFNWLSPDIPSGEHEIRVYAIGVNANGQPDNVVQVIHILDFSCN